MRGAESSASVILSSVQILGRDFHVTTILVDGREYHPSGSGNLLEVCLSLGIEIPYFCWHPELGSVGACRQCAVKWFADRADDNGRLVMSCVTPLTDGARISVDDDEARRFRRLVAEMLMLNHPHDCPVCEEGGDCHLQSMTILNRHSKRRYRFEKRRYRSQYLGPLISHEMNRCVHCYRCVRYYRDYAGGKDFGVYAAASGVYFGRDRDGRLESEFSGNLADVCPTGVFTDRIYSQHYARRWAMRHTPSICHQCAVGCNITLCSGSGKLRKVDNRFNADVNGYFLCDLGRFGYEYLNSAERPKSPVLRRDGDHIRVSARYAVDDLALLVREDSDSGNVVGIGSPRASLESNFALQELVGVENFYLGVSSQEHRCLRLISDILLRGDVQTFSPREVENCDAILILGEDLTATGPRIALSVRQAVRRMGHRFAEGRGVDRWHSSALDKLGQGMRHPLFITSTDSTGLDDVAVWSYCAAIADQVRFGRAVACVLQDGIFPEGADHGQRSAIHAVAERLSRAVRPLIISGSSSGSVDLIRAAYSIARIIGKKNHKVGLNLVVGDVNSIGVAMLGDGGSLEDLAARLTGERSSCVIVLESDPYRHVLPSHVSSIISGSDRLVVIDHQRTPIHEKADLVLPASNFAESSGTVVNYEGRIQHFTCRCDTSPRGGPEILESWRWLCTIKYPRRGEQLACDRCSRWADLVRSIVGKIAPLSHADVVAWADLHREVCNDLRAGLSPRARLLRFDAGASSGSAKPQQLIDGSDLLVNDLRRPPHPRETPCRPSGENFGRAQRECTESRTHLRRSMIRRDGRQIGDEPERQASGRLESENDQQGWQITIRRHLFGSDETSQHSPTIRKLSPRACAVLSVTELERLGCRDGSLLIISHLGFGLRLPVVSSGRLRSGQVGLPLGYPGIPLILNGLRIRDLTIRGAED